MDRHIFMDSNKGARLGARKEEEMKTKDPKFRKMYLVWEENEGEGGSGFWGQYDTLEDAVSDKGDGCEVFTAEPTRLGTFRRSVEIVRVPARKKQVRK